MMLEAIIIETAINTAIKAGKETLRYYQLDTNYSLKSDDSPVTIADLESNRIIEESLKVTAIPLLSEENTSMEFSIRNSLKRYWLIDPLDGTKDFIAGSPDFTINIALIDNNYPAFGVVYLPVKDILYYGSKELGAFRRINASKYMSHTSNSLEKDLKLPFIQNTGKTVVVASRTHTNKQTLELIQKAKSIFKNIEIESYGSSLKLCMIAEGRADLYPRLGPTMEWDIAAGHAIVEASGNKLLQYPTLEKLVYNKEDMLNPWFIALKSENEKAVKEILLLP